MCRIAAGKEEGNAAFREERFEEALERYTEVKPGKVSCPLLPRR